MLSHPLAWLHRILESIILLASIGANRAVLQVIFSPCLDKVGGRALTLPSEREFKTNPGPTVRAVAKVEDLDVWSSTRASQVYKFDVFEMKHVLGGIKDRR